MSDFELPCPPLPAVVPSDLLAQAQPMNLGRGEALFRQGDPVSHVAFVLEGAPKAVRHPSDGSECVRLCARAGELFAESSLADSRYRCDGITVCQARLLWWLWS